MGGNCLGKCVCPVVDCDAPARSVRPGRRGRRGRLCRTTEPTSSGSASRDVDFDDCFSLGYDVSHGRWPFDAGVGMSRMSAGASCNEARTAPAVPPSVNSHRRRRLTSCTRYRAVHVVAQSAGSARGRLANERAERLRDVQRPLLKPPELSKRVVRNCPPFGRCRGRTSRYP